MEQSRRAFMVSAATIGSAATVLGGVVWGQQSRGASAPPDPVLDQIVQEVFASLRELESSAQPKPDVVRGLAVTARLTAAHVRAIDFDRRLAAGVRRVHDRVGRERLIDQASGPEMHRKHQETLRTFGVQGHYGGEEYSRDKYHETMNAILAGRPLLGAELDRIATLLDVRYRRLAAARGTAEGGGLIVQAQSECLDWQELCSAASLYAQLQCMMLGWLPEFGGIACLMAQAWASMCCYMAGTCGR